MGVSLDLVVVAVGLSGSEGGRKGEGQVTGVIGVGLVHLKLDD